MCLRLIDANSLYQTLKTHSQGYENMYNSNVEFPMNAGTAHQVPMREKRARKKPTNALKRGGTTLVKSDYLMSP
jgi:hypothetical protein